MNEYGQATPPQDLAAEQGVLGSMMLSKDAIADCIPEVSGRDFYRPAHEAIYEAIMSLYGDGQAVDAITVADTLTKTGQLARIGGASYLHDLVQSVATSANASYYAQIVRERSVLRRLVEAGTRITQMGYGQGEGDVDDIVNRAQAEVYAVSEKRESNDPAPAADVIGAAMDLIEAAATRDGEMHGIPTGLTDLDATLHGLKPGQMVIVAARPAVGKSVFAMDTARAACKSGHKVLVFSLEMSRAEMMLRIIAAESSVQLNELQGGLRGQEKWTKLGRAMAPISEWPLFIDDSPNLTLMEIRAKARRHAQVHGLDLIIVDYLQLLTSGKKVENRQQEVAEFSRALKLLAKELEVPVIAVAQLNRGPEQRADKRPQMSDLRESGSLEQDADVVILLHRDKDDPERAGEADILLAKHRNGPTRDIVAVFQGHYARFMDMAPEPSGF